MRERMVSCLLWGVPWWLWVGVGGCWVDEGCWSGRVGATVADLTGEREH